jgi:hypothetical protein
MSDIDFTSQWREFMVSEQTSNVRKSMRDLFEHRELSTKQKVDRLIFERVLTEGRREDVIKKYPQYEETIDTFFTGDNDPSGNNKYLAKMVKLLEHEMKSWKAGNAATGNVPDEELVNRYMYVTARRIKHNVIDFHNMAKYMKGAKQSTDINTYKSLFDLQKALDEAEKVKDKKEQEKIHKAKMREDADRIYQDKTTLVVRPQSEGASCYYGQGTKWCISATDSQNYWNKYTEEDGAIFFFILDKEVAKRADDDNPNYDSRYENAGKIAFVYNGDHLYAEQAWDAYDEVDDQVEGDIRWWYEETWGEEKTQAIIDGIQESIDEDPPEEGFDLEEAIGELEEYVYGLETIDWNNEEGGVGISVEFNEWTDYPSVEVRAEVALYFDEYDLETASEDADIEDIVETAVNDFSMDYEEMDFDIDTYNGRIGVTLHLRCQDCYANENSSAARERSAEGAREFIDEVDYTWGGDDFQELHSNVYDALVTANVLPLTGFHLEKADLAAFAQTLEHFSVNVDEPTVITFSYTQGDGGGAPILSDKTATEAYQLSDFSAEKILQQVDARAQEFAKQQMSLDFGDKYDTSASPAPTFPKHNFSHTLKKNAGGEVFLNLAIAIAKGDSEEDKALAKNYLTYLNDNYDTIIKAFREELQSSVAGAEESEALAQSRVQSGEFIKTMLDEIEEAVQGIPGGDTAMEAVNWFRRNLDEMTPLERSLAAKYLARHRGSSNPATTLYMSRAGGDTPAGWYDLLKRELADAGASQIKADQISREMISRLSEQVRQRVRQVIAEHLKK